MSFLAVSLETANGLYAWGWRLSFCGAVITAIGVALLMWGTRARDHDFESQVAHLNKSAADANERAASIEKTSETLRIEAARAQEALERERVERLKLEERVRPRSLTADQENIVIDILSHSPKGTVFVVPKWMDPEAESFGRQIESLLKRSGFDVLQYSGSNKPLSYGILGAFLVIKDTHRRPPHFDAIHNAFKAVGIDLPAYQEDYVPNAQSVLIGISSKP